MTPSADDHRRLDVERTRLANERTLLAYARTALAVAAGGVSLLCLFDLPIAGRVLGVGVILLGAMTLGFGIWRYVDVARGLR
ncbi:MAG TPA: DUF202 domain-containing protein [Planctomycetota bacterium]|nr:DUF202 domain-containing protein [Planctomycetota bacterium]